MTKKVFPKFVIISAVKSENTLDLVQEINKKGFSVELIRISDVSFVFSSGNVAVYFSEKNLLDSDIFIFRGFNIHSMEAQLLAKVLLNKGKIVVDEVIGKEFLMGKAYESVKLSFEKVLQPETLYMNNFNLGKDILKRISFPIMVKPVFGEQGKDIHKFDDKRTAREFFKKSSESYLLQKYLPIEEDYRVFIVGNKVLGAIKRFVIKGDYRSNASLGAVAEKAKVFAEMKAIALRAKKAMGLEIAGVDLLRYNGRWFVLEVNHTPQWQKFKEVTGINPAKEIVKYCLKKHERNFIN